MIRSFDTRAGVLVFGASRTAEEASSECDIYAWGRQIHNMRHAVGYRPAMLLLR